MGRPAVVISLPPEELQPVAHELNIAGFETIAVDHPSDLEATLDTHPDVAVAVLDSEADFDRSLALYEMLHEDGRDIPALLVVPDHYLERLAGSTPVTSIDDEYLSRPFSAESVRWRIEAMLIRSQTVDDERLHADQPHPRRGLARWGDRRHLLAKGGVSKTWSRRTWPRRSGSAGPAVLPTPTPSGRHHVARSSRPDGRRHWREPGMASPGPRIASLIQQDAGHLTSSPLHTDVLRRGVADAIGVAARSTHIVDTHPSYGPLNMAIFDRADRILLPVTPDLPALRAAVQLRDVATELGISDRISMVVNRANSGVSVADMERTVGIPALALIRSGGMLFRAANEAPSSIAPRGERDFDQLADKPCREATAEDRSRPLERSAGVSSSLAPDRPRASGSQRDLSVQVVPPSGRPGSGWTRVPVRLSTCETPRR
jgi:hypothetical protein